jgi:iron(III) transport system permease protein
VDRGVTSLGTALPHRGTLGYGRRLARSIGNEPVKATIVFVVFLLLAGLILYPLAEVVGVSLEQEDGRLGVGRYLALLSDAGIGRAAVLSLYYMIEVSAGCLVLGVVLAWLVTRSNMPGKAFVRVGAAIAFVVPSFINVIAWIFLLAPNSGYINKLLMQWFGLSEPPINLFSFDGLVFIETAHLFPVCFFAVSAALANIDASHEQAARVLGAGRLRTVRTITLPLVTPAIVSSIILSMLDALSSFGAPSAIGTMANFSLLSTKIYELIAIDPHLELAAALSVPVGVFTLILLWIQQRLIRPSRFVTLTGKSVPDQLVDLGAWRHLVMALVWSVIFCLAILPVLALIVLSLLNAFGTDIRWSNLGFSHYAAVFDTSFTVLTSVKNSLILAVEAATICIAVGVVLAWLVERAVFPGRGVAIGIVSVAFGVPAIVLGIGVLLGYTSALYGTLTIVLIAYAGRHLPIAFLYVRSLIAQVSPQLEEAARVSGAGWGRMLKDVTVPMLWPGASVAWLLIFSLCLREQPMSAILTQFDSTVMSTAVLQFLEDGSIEVAAAISVLIIVVSIGCLLLAKAIAFGRSLQSRLH